MDWNLEVVMADDVGFGGFKLTFGDRGPNSGNNDRWMDLKLNGRLVGLPPCLTLVAVGHAVFAHESRSCVEVHRLFIALL